MSTALLPVNSRPNVALTALLLGILVGLLGVGIIRDFSGPLLDGGDTDQYAYTSYYFSRNLSVWPAPLLNLYNNQTLYPYGTHHVFLPWGFERDYLYALLDHWPNAEYKPFLQSYYLYSLIVSSVGTFLLLHKRFGYVRALIAGLIVSVFSFYGLYKYPVHLNMAVVHWTVLCMLATFLLLYNLYHSHQTSLRFWLVWAWLHLAILGLELGYVAGYSLAFSTLSIPFIAYLLWQNSNPYGSSRLQALTNWLAVDYKANRISVIGLVLLCVFTAWLYVPLSGQISIDALGYTFPTISEMRVWSHPLRLLIPNLPGIHSNAIPYEQYLHDQSIESYAQTSPGLYLVILAAVGLWQQRTKISLWGPIVLMLLLCLLYHPVMVPTLKLFPWFAFNRHGGRSSMVYPALLCMLALPIRWPLRRAGQVAFLAVMGLLLTEWYQGYTYRQADPPDAIPPTLFTYLQTVRDTPGKAVLDWPFCIQGADALQNSDGLCPFYEAQNGVNTLRRFYHKAVVGQYVGRMHPDLVKPLLRDEWPRLLAPDYQFTTADWDFFDSFLRTNQFAGINLYTSLLTPRQTQAFLTRYGPAIAETTHPMAGRMLFLPLNRQVR